MIDTLKLVIRIHLILGFSLIFTLLITGVKKLGIKKMFQDMNSDIYFWFIIFEFLINPYRVMLIAFAETGKRMAEACDKIKKMAAKGEVNNG